MRMGNRRWHRPGRALVSVVTACSAVLLVAPEASEAQVPTDYTVLTGNYFGDGRDEAFYYAPGTTPDTMIGFTKDLVGNAQLQVYGNLTANGTYTPLVGDFDGDGFDEILWYAPGTAADSMWHLRADGSVASVPYQINGSYPRAMAGDFTGDSTDDVLWYAPGTAPDVMWDFNQGGGYTSTGRTISGTYQPVVGSFGNDVTDDILWYAPGTAKESLWDHVPGSTSYTQQVFDVRGTYRPFAVDMYGDGPGGEDIFWYAPGAAGDSVWDFYLGQRFNSADSQPGTYLAAAGDFFGDGVEDILWDNAAETVMWDHHYVGTSPQRLGWLWPKAPPAAAPAERSATPTAPGLAPADGTASGTPVGPLPGR